VSATSLVYAIVTSKRAPKLFEWHSPHFGTASSYTIDAFVEKQLQGEQLIRTMDIHGQYTGLSWFVNINTTDISNPGKISKHSTMAATKQLHYVVRFKLWVEVLSALWWHVCLQTFLLELAVVSLAMDGWIPGQAATISRLNVSADSTVTWACPNEV